MRPGSFVDPGAFDGPGGPVVEPGRLVVGDGPEIVEPPDRAEGSPPIDVTSGVTVNGRIGAARRGRRLSAQGQGGREGPGPGRGRGRWARGSTRWSRSATRKGRPSPRTTTRNNAFPPDQARSVSAVGVPEASPDSSLDYEAKADGVVTIEVADRFGDGGPEYAYRLAIGPARPDFAVTLLLGNANINARRSRNLARPATARTSPGQFGVFNLKPGASTPINFLVAPEGRPGPVEVRVEGLPEGVTAEPVTRPARRSAAPGDTRRCRPTPASPTYLLKVAPYAQPGLGEIRIVATSKPRRASSLTREATATIGIDSAAVSGRPITRVISRIPLRIVGEARPLFVGPPAPPDLAEGERPRPLAPGGPARPGPRLRRASVTADDGSTVEAKAEGVGLATNTVISAGTSTDRRGGDPRRDRPRPGLDQGPARAAPGQGLVHAARRADGDPTRSRSRSRPRSRSSPAPKAIFLRPGDAATFKVEVRREAGFDGEVELKLEGLPRGVKAAKGVTIGAGMTAAEVRLEMDPEAKPIAKPAELRVVGMARMPRGNVAVESENPTDDPAPTGRQMR